MPTAINANPLCVNPFDVVELIRQSMAECRFALILIVLFSNIGNPCVCLIVPVVIRSAFNYCSSTFVSRRSTP